MVQKKLPTINSSHGSETRNIINEIIKTINDRGLEILSESGFLSWLEKNGIKHREEVATFADLPSDDSLNTVRGVADENKIYIKKENGWVSFQSIDVNKLGHIETYVKRKEVDIWDFLEDVPDRDLITDPNEWDWTKAIQNAIDFVTSSYEYNKLVFPPGKYKINETVGYWGEGDIDIGLHIVGSGRTATTGRATTIEQTDPTKDCFNLTNTRSNIRGFIMEDIQLYGGKVGLNLSNSVYNLFNNISFSRQREYCILSSVGSLNWFSKCYFVHAGAEALRFNGPGTNYFSDCTIGEDIGGIHVNTGMLKFNNCSFHDVRNRNETEGLYGLGNNIFGVDNGGQLNVINSNIRTNRENAEVLVTTNNQRSSSFVNCNINLQNQTVLVSRYQTLAYTGQPFNFIDCVFEWEGNATLFENGVGAGSSSLLNSILDGNTFKIPAGVNIQTEDWFLDSSKNNKIGLNTVVEV